jgi:hypothetical protein
VDINIGKGRPQGEGRSGLCSFLPETWQNIHLWFAREGTFDGQLQRLVKAETKAL